MNVIHRLALGFLAVLGSAAAIQAQQPAAVPDPSPGSYRIGIEDVLSIVTWDEPKLTLSATVRPDGRITMPLANDIEVVGLTPDEVRRKITERLSKFVRDPSVTVMVEKINSFRVYFLGEIKTQGPIQMFRPTRLLQGISAAGGLTEFSKKEIMVLREEAGTEKRIEINYKRLIQGENLDDNIYLKPGDTVVVR